MMMIRKAFTELLGTALLVFFAVGTATLAFGFKLAGESTAAGVVMTALAFGLVLVALVYAIGPISGCHVNPAVTLGFVVARRMTLKEAWWYWGAQFVGGIIGALALWAVFADSHGYSRASVGLGADGYGAHSIIGVSIWGALLTEIVLTFLFVLTVLLATRHAATAGFAGLAIGMALAAVHLVGIPLTGTSVNPARSLGPALVVGGDALKQLWMFIVGPLVGGALAAACSRLMIRSARPVAAGRVDAADMQAQPA